MVGCRSKRGCAESSKKELGLRKTKRVMGRGLTRIKTNNPRSKRKRYYYLYSFGSVMFVSGSAALSEVSIYRVRLRLEFVTDEQKLCLDWDPGETEQNAQCSRIGKTNACHAVLDFWIRTAFGLIT
ncbi:transmembrane protein, putative [Medicago truncatula]|uniref:Transmembrane protein, putative n=1 Tax=Medicago truncatula TaxID=3880 RepID=A0A072U1M2_MEDTR|nr:transmembrane protein, putative [Medicago truncatula]